MKKLTSSPGYNMICPDFSASSGVSDQFCIHRIDHLLGLIPLCLVMLVWILLMVF